jgi:hypothetical protein
VTSRRLSDCLLRLIDLEAACFFSSDASEGLVTGRIASLDVLVTIGRSLRECSSEEVYSVGLLVGLAMSNVVL